MGYNDFVIKHRFPDCCKDCKPPKRHIGCHGTCPEYLGAKAEHIERDKAIRKAKKNTQDADSATYIMKRN